MEKELAHYMKFDGLLLEVKRAKARLKARTEPSRALGSAQLSSPNSISEKAQLSSARQI